MSSDVLRCLIALTISGLVLKIKPRPQFPPLLGHHLNLHLDLILQSEDGSVQVYVNRLSYNYMFVFFCLLYLNIATLNTSSTHVFRNHDRSLILKLFTK